MDPSPWQYGNRQYSIKLSDTGVAGLQESPLDMSSLSRRACYKCGNVGHYAGQQHASQAGEQGMQANIMQKYAHHQNAYAITVSFYASLVLPLRALTVSTGKQPGMHLLLLDVTLR